MRKQKKTAVYVFICMLLIIGGIIFYNFASSGKFLATIPLEDFGKKSISPYDCPQDVSLCKVQGVCEVDIQKAEGVVVARTNIDLSRVPCGRYGCSAGDIETYLHNSSNVINVKSTDFGDANSELSRSYFACESGSASHCYFTGSDYYIKSALFSFTQKTPDGVEWKLYFGYAGGNTYIFINEGSGVKGIGLNNYGYTSDKVPSTPQSIQSYLSKGQEVIMGNANIFNGVANFELRGQTNNLITFETLAYSSNYPGSKATSIYELQPGQRATISGCDDSYITYGTYQVYNQCNYNVCNSDNTGFKTCTNGQLSDSTTFCNIEAGEICKNGACEFPFTTKSIAFSDGLGNVKPSFIPGEKIYIKSTITSSRLSTGAVTFKVYSGSNKIEELSVSDYNFQDGRARLIEITNPTETGEYYATAEIPVGATKVKIGTNEEFTFRIGLPISLSFSVPYTTKTGTALLTNVPVYLDLRATDENGQPTSASSIFLEVKYNGVILPVPDYVKPQPEAGLYRFIYTFPNPGLLQIKAYVEKFGVKSNEKYYSALEIKSPQIVSKITNIGMLRTIPPSTQTIKFESKDSYGNYISTNNVVKIVPPGASTGAGDIDVSTKVTSTDTGKYSFDYDFKDVGGYTINIQSTAEGYPIGDKPLSGTITVEPGAELKDCVDSTDCDYGKLCISNKCQTKEKNILPYIIGGGIVLIIIILFLVIKLGGKKKTQSIEIGGL
jgi:hypothetical protein